MPPKKKAPKKKAPKKNVIQEAAKAVRAAKASGKSKSAVEKEGLKALLGVSQKKRKKAPKKKWKKVTVEETVNLLLDFLSGLSGPAKKVKTKKRARKKKK